MTAKKKSPNGIVHSDPSILGGTPAFVGTRVPLQNLMDYLDAGQSIDEFLEAFPSVSGNRLSQSQKQIMKSC